MNTVTRTHRRCGTPTSNFGCDKFGISIFLFVEEKCVRIVQPSANQSRCWLYFRLNAQLPGYTYFNTSNGAAIQS